MRVLVATPKHAAGQAARGLDYGFQNFVDPLREMANDVWFIDTGVAFGGVGAKVLDRVLLRAVRELEPDVLFTCLMEDEFSHRALRAVRDEYGVATVNWFADDQWRLASFSRYIAPEFSLVITTHDPALEAYADLGVHALKSQWACNPFLYMPRPGLTGPDVSFVGQPHGERRALIEALARSGIQVASWGQGWPNGRIDHEGMLRVFTRSRINLNLAATSVQGPRNRWARRINKRLSRLPGSQWLRAAKAALSPPATDPLPKQMKGRNFEIPACGGFLLTQDVPGLDECYRPGIEVATFTDATSLVHQVRRFLADPEQRTSIAKAGYNRTLSEHTWFHRFQPIFAHFGYTLPQPEAMLARGPSRRPLHEVPLQL